MCTCIRPKQLGLIFIFAGLFLHKSIIHAAKPVTKSPVLEAQEIAITQDRAKSAQFLLRSLEKENRGSAASKEMISALNNITTMFFTEKGQKTYELGRTLVPTNTQAAIDKYLEALSSETGNVAILTELSRQYLVKGECDDALEFAKQAAAMNPYSAEAFVARLQSKVCLQRLEDLDAEYSNPYINQNDIMLYVLYIKASAALLQKQFVTAAGHLKALTTMDAKFPEAYLLLARLKESQNQAAMLDWSKYVSLCKEEQSKLRVKYKLNPKVCSEVKEAEAALLKAEEKP